MENIYNPNLLLEDNLDREASSPVLFDQSKPDFLQEISLLKKNNPGFRVADRFTQQLEELFLLRNPRFRFDKNYHEPFQEFLKSYLNGRDTWQAGKWFYFSWNNVLVHYLDNDLHQELRTSRNKNLITDQEQARYYNAKVGVLGLSVGSSAALAINLTGGARFMKLADPDVISGSNLNRIRAGFQSIDVGKVISVARQIYETDPYSDVEIYNQGLREKDIENFLLKPKLDILIEEMDNLYLKFRVREIARENKIPVIMAADNGDNIVVDIERYDLDSNYPILHGILGNLDIEALKNPDPGEIPRLMAKVAAAEFNTVRMLESVIEVGKTIYSWPQLGNTAMLAGSTLSFLTRKIILKEPTKNGRIDFNIEKMLSVLDENYNDKRSALLKKLDVTQ